MPTIERIDTCGPRGRGRRLHFTDVTESRTTSAAVVRALGLEVGSRISLSEIDAVEPEAARERALALLGYRERSAAEVQDLLTGDGYPLVLARSMVQRFIELGLVDDERFARMWTASRRSAGYGPQRIRRELEAKGVDVAAVGMSSVDESDADVLERARTAIRGRVPTSNAERQRLVNRLLRRGFALGTALAVTAMGGPDEEAESAADGTLDGPFIPS